MNNDVSAAADSAPPRLEMLEGALYRNPTRGELRAVQLVDQDIAARMLEAAYGPDLTASANPYSSVLVLGPVWVMETSHPFGPALALATPEGLEACGYKRVEIVDPALTMCATDARHEARATHIADQHGCVSVPICGACITTQRKQFTALVRHRGSARCPDCGREDFTSFDEFVQFTPLTVDQNTSKPPAETSGGTD